MFIHRGPVKYEIPIQLKPPPHSELAPPVSVAAPEDLSEVTSALDSAPSGLVTTIHAPSSRLRQSPLLRQAPSPRDQSLLPSSSFFRTSKTSSPRTFQKASHPPAQRTTGSTYSPTLFLRVTGSTGWTFYAFVQKLFLLFFLFLS